MQRTVADVVIAISGTDSATTTVPSGYSLAGIITPAALTGANFSLKGAAIATAASQLPVYNGGTLYSVAMAANRFIALDTTITQGLATFQIVSDAAEAAARTFQVVYTKDR